MPTGPGVRKAAAVAFPIIVMIVSALFAISYLLSGLLGLPNTLSPPLALRLVGCAVIVAGLAVAEWIFRYRSPADMIVSTYITFTKAFSRSRISEGAGRAEPLVIIGPQRYVRNPLYFGVVVMVLGWALLTAYSFIFVAAVVFLLWFGLVMITFDERELRALFGEEWVRYSERTPMLIPLTKRRRSRGAPG